MRSGSGGAVSGGAVDGTGQERGAERWWLDRRLKWILLLGLLLRAVPLAIWNEERCARDECTYIAIADRMIAGEGMTSSVGWLWAPGYPTVLALHALVTGHSAPAQATQIPISLGICLMVAALTRRVLRGGDPARIRDASHLAALLFAVSPTHVFYAINLWSETFYVTGLLGALLLLFRARDRLERGTRAALIAALQAGVVVGLCALFRGIATYALPVYAVGLLWGRARRGLAWGQVVALALAAALTVAPYSVYASKKFGGRVISDLTLGQMMYLGNNDFEPISFDFGNGVLSPAAFVRHTAGGRDHCADQEEVVLRDRCETANGFDWIRAHPETFLQRVPYRLAQLFTPHSMLTRHLRWGRWRGMPHELAELIIAAGAMCTVLVVWAGALGMALRARGATGVMLASTLAYHVLPIALLAGLSRYRVPLEPILMVYAAILLTDRRAARALLFRSPARAVLAGALLGALIPLTLYFLPAGWPEWRSW